MRQSLGRKICLFVGTEYQIHTENIVDKLGYLWIFVLEEA